MIILWGDWKLTAGRLGGCLLTRRGEEGDYPVPHVAEALGDENIRRVFAWLAAYLKEMMKADAAEFHTVMPIREEDCLLLGEDCLRNLEITREICVMEGDGERFLKYWITPILPWGHVCYAVGWSAR